MKENDFFAVALNTEGTGVSPNDLRAYGITPNNTGLQSKDFYKDIPRVQDRFTTQDGNFDDAAYSAFYDSLKRSYSDFAQNDYIDDLLSKMPASAEDIFSLGNLNLNDDSVRIVSSRDPNRHQVGIGNIFQTGKASFSEREVAQAYNVLDEEGKELDWSPNEKGGLWKSLFRPTLALAAWDENGYHTENGKEVFHHKGEHKYDENGNPRYQKVSGEIYDKEILHWGDTVTKEGTWLNKIDPFDFDSVRTSPGRVIYSTFVRLLPYLTPAADLFGALEAAKALTKTIPVLAKSINGLFSTNNNSFGKTMTSVENWAKRFDQSTSDASEGKFFSFENIMQQVVDSAKQLYSQGLIQKIPQMLSKHPSIKSLKAASILSTAYLATTSAEDVYGDYIRAGVNERWAGIGALATMGAFYAFMSNDYFKKYLFNDPALELPELKKVVRNEIKTSMTAVEARIAKNEGIAIEAVKKGLLPSWTGEKWYHKTYNAVANAINKVGPKLINKDNAYLVRGFNEGLEEVMEEGATDIIKGLTLGARSLGFNVKDEDANDIDFGFSAEDFLTRYAQAFVGGAFGGVIFEGLQQWNNKVLHRKQRLISDLDLDEQLAWYIRNGRTNELLDIVDNFEKKGKFGSKNLSLKYTVEDGKIVWDATDDENNNQNTQLANALRQKIKTIQSELIALNFVDSDNELLQKAVSDIKKEAKANGYSDVNEYKEKRLRDEKIDFLKQRQVDKLILSDIADLQYNIRILHEGIVKRKEDLIAKAGDGHTPSEEELKKDPIIKLKQEQLDERKKALDDILSGNHANEYLSIGLFAGDDKLVDLYLARKAEEGKKSYYLTDVKKYVRAKYGVNLDELIEKTGGRDENNRSEIEDYFLQEFDEWTKAEDLYKIRGAFEIHKRLGKIINPIVKDQIKNYSGYKSDPERQNLINLVQDDESRKKAREEYDAASKAVDDYVNSNRLKFAPYLDESGKMSGSNLDRAMAMDTNFAKLVNNFKIAESNIAFFEDPRTALDRAFKGGDDNKKEFLESLSFGSTEELFNFLERYYKHLNDEKIVSEFSDDFYRIGIATAANKARVNTTSRLKAIREAVLREIYSIPEDYVSIIENLASDKELANIVVEIQLSDTDEVEEHSIQEVFQYLADNIAGDSSRSFFFNGKVARISEHLVDNFDYEKGSIVSQLTPSEIEKLYDEFDIVTKEFPDIDSRTDSETGWIDTLSRDLSENIEKNKSVADDGLWQAIVSRLNGVLQAFEKDPDYGLEAYNGAIEMINGLIKDGTFNPGVDAKTWVDKMLFDDIPNIAEEVLKLKALRANMIHTPILDWIRAMSSELGGVKQDLLNLLEAEVKGLVNSKTIDEYVIKNPFAKEELEYLENALNAAAAVLQGAAPIHGANFYINQLIKDDDDKLPLITDPTLADVYEQDLLSMIDRVSVLNTLSRRNSKGTIRARQEAMAVSAPKLFKAFLKRSDNPAEKPEDNPFWIGQFYKILGIDINELWNDRFDLDSVTVDNLDLFWEAARGFLDDLYNAIKNVDWEKVSAENGNLSVNQILTEVLFGKVTEAWRLKNSKVDSDLNTKIEDLDVALFMAGILAIDPKETFGRMKAASEDPSIGKKPFWDQMMAIVIGFGKTQNKELFNEIGKHIWLSQKAKAENPDDPDFKTMTATDAESARAYFGSRPLIENALNIDGASGTGKSQIVLRFIHYMNEQDTEKPTTVICAKYGNRIKALQDILKVSDDSCFTLNELETKLLGRALTTDDFVDNTVDGSELNGHARQLKPEVIELIKNNAEWWTDGVINMYIDESGLFSEAELVFLSEVSKKGKVNLIFAGDKMQNGATTESGKTSGIMDTVTLGTPRLNISMRVGNWGMVYNLDMLEQDLDTVSSVYQDTPWITSEAANSELGGTLRERDFKYTEKADTIYGFRIINNGVEALEKLKTFKKNPKTKVKIAVITDNPSKYSSYVSSDIKIISVEEVQGDEFDYVLADVEHIDESRPDNYYKKVYTIISRAKTGGYIVNGLGSKFSKSSDDPLAATIVNPSSDVDEATDMSLDKYNAWWIEKLMKKEVWGAPVSTSGSSTSGSPSPSGSTGTSGGTGPTGGTGSGGAGSGAPGRGSASHFTGAGGVSMPEFDEASYKAHILDPNVSEEDLLNEDTLERSKQRKDDIRNYRKYHQTLAEEEKTTGTGTLVDFKGYIDWLFDESDNLLFGNEPYNLTNVNGLNDDEKTRLKELIRNLALDLFELSGDEIKDKWSDLETSPIGTWTELLQNAEFGEKLKNYIINSGDKLLLYAVKDGNFSYFYVIVDKKAIPVARVKGGTQTGWVRINKKTGLNRITPLTVLSSDGKAVTDPYDPKFTRYANISRESYLINIDPNEAEFSDEDTKRFVKHARGIGQVVIQSTFGTPADKFLLPRKKDDSYERVDSTGESKNRARFMAVSKHITFETYLKLSEYLNELWHRHKLTSEQYNELQEYVTQKDYSELTQLESDSERIKAFRRSSILTPDKRDLLVTAIMRYFSSDAVDKSVSERFFSNINAWVSSEEHTSKWNGNPIQRQKGLKFSLRDSFGSSIDFHIVLNSDKKSYSVYYKSFDFASGEDIEEVLIPDLGNENYFKFTSTNPVTIAESLLTQIINAINEKITYADDASDTEKEQKEQNKQKYGRFLAFAKNYLSSPDYNTLFKNGTIAFGLTTKRIKTIDGKTTFGWFNPFDSDISDLFDGISYNSNIEDFLKSDSVFKYNIIVGVHLDENQNDPDGIWLTSTQDAEHQWSWDIIDIVPPLYQFGVIEEVEDTSALPTLGILGHSGSTDDKTKINVEAKLNDDNEVISYTFNINFRISKDDLSNYIDVSSLSAATEFEIKNITKESDGKFYLTVDGKKIEISEKSINELISGMVVTELGNNIIIKNNDWKLRATASGIVLENNDGSEFNNIQIIDYSNNTLTLWAEGNIIVFDNVNKETVDKLGFNQLSQNTIYLGIYNDTVWYYDQNNNQIIRINATEESIEHVTVNGNNVYLGNRLVTIPENILNKLKPLLPSQPVSPKVVDKAKEKFASVSDLDFNDPTLKYNPDAWAIKNAEKLDGIYVWSGKTWGKPKNEQVKWAYSKLIANETGKSAIDVYTSVGAISVNDSGTIVVDGREFKVEQIGEGYVLSELFRSNQDVDQFINDVKALGNEQVTNIFEELFDLHVKKNTGKQYSEQKMGELYGQLLNLTGDDRIGKLFGRFESDIAEHLDDTIKCNFK